MANRVYEIMVMAIPTITEDELSQMKQIFEKILVDQGASVIKQEDWGVRKLAFPIKHRTEGHYLLFEVEGTGKEIAELERRLRVSDYVIRYLTVRVDEDRKTAAKITAKRDAYRAKRAQFSKVADGTDVEDEFISEAELDEVE